MVHGRPGRTLLVDLPLLDRYGEVVVDVVVAEDVCELARSKLHVADVDQGDDGGK